MRVLARDRQAGAEPRVAIKVLAWYARVGAEPRVG
jgi:hypothetical protein